MHGFTLSLLLVDMLAAFGLPPATAYGGEDEERVSVVQPPGAQLVDHFKADGHVAVLAPFAVSDVEFEFFSINVIDLHMQRLG